jgi:hypothetical protein
MDPDRDLAASLPDAPPPRPDRREAAIAEALRRFDGGSERPPAPATPAPRRFGRPQLAMLATALLVVAVGLPVALTENPWSGAPEPDVPATIAPPASPALQQSQIAAPSASLAPGGARQAPAPALVTSPAATPTGRVEPSEPAFAKTETAPDLAKESAAPAMPPAAPPPPPPPQAIAGAALNRLPTRPQAHAADRAESDEVVVTGSRIQRSDYAAASPIVTVDTKSLSSSNAGDWNACTIDDPAEDLRRCGKLADPAAPGARGRAAAHLADGLSRGWAGDLDGAIAAFDQAVAQSPRLAIAWLNRGLAWRRKGDPKRALTDLDQAVRYAPGAARGYYYRSLLLRQRGDARRALADERRAVELDARYLAVVGDE